MQIPHVNVIFSRTAATARLLLAAALTGCGGSGDDGATGNATAVQIAITEQNALALAADAVDVLADSGPDALRGLLAGAELLAGLVPPAGQMPATVACPIAGSVSATLSAGGVALEADVCQLEAAGPVYYGNVTVDAGSAIVDPGTNNSMQTTDIAAHGFSVTQGGTRTTLTGDLVALRTSTGRISGVTYSGLALAYVRASATAQRNVTLRAYEQSTQQTIIGPAFTTMTATVETSNDQFGPGIWSYQFSTPLAFTAGAGSIAVEGVGSSLLAATTGVNPITSVRSYRVTADTNGDGTDDFSVNSVVLSM